MTQPPPDPGQSGLYPREQPGFPPGYAAPGPQPFRAAPGYGPPYQPYPAGGYQQRLGKDPRLADWLERFLARVIDGIVVFALVSALLLPIHFSTVHQISLFVHDLENNAHSNATRPAAGPVLPTGRLLVAILVGAVANFGYDWLQHGLWGQTLGKRALGTIVLTADTWSKIGGRAAGLRAAVYVLPVAVPYAGGFFSLLDEAWLLWDNRRQCLHDKAARTVVLKKYALTSQVTSTAGRFR